MPPDRRGVRVIQTLRLFGGSGLALGALGLVGGCTLLANSGARWPDSPDHLAQPDRDPIAAGRDTREPHLVAVLEEAAGTAVGQREGFGAVPGQFDERPALAWFGPGDRARGEEVA